MDDLHAKLCQLRFNNRRERILDASVENLAARRQHSRTLNFIRQKLEQRLSTAQLLYTLHFFLFNDQGNYARTAQLISLVHRRVAMTCSNHHLAKAVDELQALAVHLEQAVHSRRQLNLAFLHGGLAHALALAQVDENPCRVIFVQHAFVCLPHVKMLLTNRKQHGNILRLHDMSLAEHCVLRHALDNLRQVMTQNAAYCVLSSYQLHCSSLISLWQSHIPQKFSLPHRSAGRQQTPSLLRPAVPFAARR